MLALVAASSSRSCCAKRAAGGRAPAARVRRHRLRQPPALRAATHFDRTPVSAHPDFQHFIDATGIVPERDLDARRLRPPPHGQPQRPQRPGRLLRGLRRPLRRRPPRPLPRSIATAQEDYAGHTVYTIPIEGRQLRIAQLGYDTVAASNMPTAEQIHAMLDRYRAAASPFSGSSLLAARYHDVPLLSTAWGIGHIGLPFSERGRITVFGIDLPLPEDTTFVASLRSVGALHLRIEQIAPTDADAARSAAALSLHRRCRPDHPTPGRRTIPPCGRQSTWRLRLVH